MDQLFNRDRSFHWDSYNRWRSLHCSGLSYRYLWNSKCNGWFYSDIDFKRPSSIC